MIVFPGTFDPVTQGHVRLVERAVNIFGQVLVAVAAGANKQTLFSPAMRLRLAEHVWGDSPHVTVKPMTGLMVDFMAKEQCSLVLRGLRNASDFHYEQHLEAANARLTRSLEWCYLATEPVFMGVSSSIVREILREGGDAEAFLPPGVGDLIKVWGNDHGLDDHR